MKEIIPLFDCNKSSLKTYVEAYYGNPYIHHLERAIIDNVQRLNWTDLNSISFFVRSLSAATRDTLIVPAFGHALRCIYDKCTTLSTNYSARTMESQVLGVIYQTRDSIIPISFLDTSAQQTLFKSETHNSMAIIDFMDSGSNFSNLSAYLESTLILLKKMRISDKEKLYKNDGLAYISKLIFNSKRYGFSKSIATAGYLKTVGVASSLIPDLFKYCLTEKEDQLSFFISNLHINHAANGIFSSDTDISDLNHKYFKKLYPDEYNKYIIYTNVNGITAPHITLQQIMCTDINDSPEITMEF